MHLQILLIVPPKLSLKFQLLLFISTPMYSKLSNYNIHLKDRHFHIQLPTDPFHKMLPYQPFKTINQNIAILQPAILQWLCLLYDTTQTL